VTIVSTNYVVWDGEAQYPYKEDRSVHDCAILHDGSYLSVQRLRRWMIRQGIDVVLIFSCRSGTYAEEGEIDGVYNGAFTYCWNKVLRENPSISLRDALSQTNKLILKNGYSQQGEIICPKDLLDDSYLTCKVDRKLAILLFDMCRVSEK